ncbi:MAG: hypothetical protein IPP81_12825 [Chitinophagaceae bacterium]|nr:hypothetical protein [Chitinophagaceae bacterium]
MFSSQSGFTISFDDIHLEHTDIEYEKGLTAFYTLFYNKIKHLVNTEQKSDQEASDWNIIKKLLGNPDALKD